MKKINKNDKKDLEYMIIIAQFVIFYVFISKKFFFHQFLRNALYKKNNFQTHIMIITIATYKHKIYDIYVKILIFSFTYRSFVKN